MPVRGNSVMFEPERGAAHPHWRAGRRPSDRSRKAWSAPRSWSRRPRPWRRFASTAARTWCRAALLEDRAQAARAGLALQRLAAIACSASSRNSSSAPSISNSLLILLDQRVLRLGQDLDQRVLVELIERRDHRQAADQFRDQAELDQIFGLHVVEHVAAVRPRVDVAHLGGEADAALLGAVQDDLLEAGERAAADEQDVGACRPAGIPASDACGRPAAARRPSCLRSASAAPAARPRPRRRG